MKKIPHYNIVTIGSAVQDSMFYTKEAEVIRNPKADPTKLKLIGFEYGAKIHSDKVYLLFGGGATNTAVASARLGLRVAAILRVGQDSTGDDITNQLRDNKVVTDYIQYDTKIHTGRSFLVIDEASDEHVAFVHYGANKNLQITTQVLKQFTTDWFYVPSLSMKNWSQAMQRIIATGSQVAWNPGNAQLHQVSQMKKFLPQVQVLIVNKDEAIELSMTTGLKDKFFTIKKLAHHIFKLGVPVVVITNGLAGAHVYDGKTIYSDKPKPTKPKDTTGAGDAFGATFITGLNRRPNDYTFALRLATLNATAQVTEVGAQTGLLTWKQITQRI